MEARHDESTQHAMPPAVAQHDLPFDNAAPTNTLWRDEFATPSTIDNTLAFSRLAPHARLDYGCDGDLCSPSLAEHTSSTSPGMTFTPWMVGPEGANQPQSSFSHDWANWTPPPDATSHQHQMLFHQNQQQQQWLGAREWSAEESHSMAAREWSAEESHLMATSSTADSFSGEPTPSAFYALPPHTPSVASSTSSPLPQQHSSTHYISPFRAYTLSHQQPRHAPPSHLSARFADVGDSDSNAMRVAKKACIPCRKQKVSCDNERPCGRCTKFGRECIDRTEDEVTAAKARRRRVPTRGGSSDSVAPSTSSRKSTKPSLKRPSPYSDIHVLSSAVPAHLLAHSSAAAAPMATIDPASYANSVEETDRVSMMLFSKSFLAVLTKLQLRDTVLSLHAVLDSLPLGLPNLLEWHTHCTMMLLQLSEQLSTEDWTTFLTDGLTEQQLSSPVWLSSPLAPWLKLSTRPLFFAVQPRPAYLDSAPGSISGSGSNVSSKLAEMRLEFLPAANTVFQRWQRMLINRILYERQLRADRTPLPPTPLALTPISTEYDDAYARSNDGDDDELDDLTKKFTLLDWAPALSVAPPEEGEHNAVDTTLHAQWCQRSALALAASLDPTANASAPKMTRTSVNHSTTPASANAKVGRTTILADSPTCLCSLSTPLLCFLDVNPALEALFGWRRVEIEAGICKEGTGWLRRLYPPSGWPVDQFDQASNWKSQIKYLAEKAAAACRAATAPSTAESPAHTVTPPTAWVPKREHVRSKNGDISLGTYRRSLYVQASDGAQLPTAWVTFWTPSTAGSAR